MTVLQSNILRLTMFYERPSGDVSENVHHFQYLDPASQPDSQVVDDLSEWSQFWAAAWADLASVDETLARIAVHLFLPSGVWQLIGEVVLNVVGQAVTQGLPEQDSGLLTRKVASGRGTGKKWIPGMTEGQQNNGIWEPNSLSLQAILANLWATKPQDLPLVFNNYQTGSFRKEYNILHVFSDTTIISSLVEDLDSRKPGKGS